MSQKNKCPRCPYTLVVEVQENNITVKCEKCGFTAEGKVTSGSQ